jgi:glycosyltransferase involved in cell wall biosynthesis
VSHQRQLRICFVTPFGYPVLAGDRDCQVIGGAEVQQLLVSTELARRGHDVSMISMDFGQTEGERVRGVRCLKMHGPDAGLPALRFLHPRLTSLWAAMKRADADIYYQRSSGCNTGFVAAFARRHGRGMVFASAAATDFDPDLPRLQLRRDKWLFRYGMAHASHVVVQSQQQLENCRKMFGREATRINSCYGHRGAPGRHDGVILWVGNTRAHKRPDLFLDLAQRLPQYQFKLVGGSSLDDESFQSLTARARSLPNVQITGFLPLAEAELHFDGASLIVNTSPAEGFPNTFLQAWSRSIPSVSFFDVGAKLDAADVGCHVDGLDAMAEAVIRLKTDERHWRERGLRCSQYVARNNSVGKVVDSYERVFETMVPTLEVVSA